MAKKAHLKKLSQGVVVWNKWREANPDIDIDFSELSLIREISIRAYQQVEIIFSRIITALITPYLSNSELLNNLDKLIENYFSLYSNNIFHAKFIIFISIRIFLFIIVTIIIEKVLIETILIFYRNKLNLANINFSEVNLYKADLQGIDLSYSNLSFADLRNSNLSYVQAIGTDFSYANLTGACIENWNIDSSTKINDVKCDYIYLFYNHELLKFDQRRPIDTNSIFAPNEFTERVRVAEKALETIDLTFTDGIDWKAFFKSFNELHQQYPEQNINIQGIERKNNTLIVRLDVNIESGVKTDVVKGAIETGFKELYETNAKFLEAQYRRELQAKDDEIIFYRQQSTNLLEIIRQQATRPINVEHIMSEIYNNDLKQANIGNFANKNADNARQQANQYVHLSEQKQTLAEAAAEIQRLLKQLEQNDPTATETEKIAYVNDETTPSFKRRFIGALQGGTETAIEEFLDNSYINIVKAIIKGWIKPD
ncbi:pentapeptide repeat-containing protein [Nostoc sp. UHCC 0702]|nr:pentapeptide repeat-containing protein [Nostoc sp. UHCC 0702]